MTELPARPKPPTIREVARAAGVSTALVSIVMRGAKGASPATRERVLKAAHEIGYRDQSSLPSAVIKDAGVTAVDDIQHASFNAGHSLGSLMAFSFARSRIYDAELLDHPGELTLRVPARLVLDRLQLTARCVYADV